MQPVMKDPAMNAGIPKVSANEMKKNEPKKLFGMDSRSIATVVGLTGFFIIAMAGVVISLRTRFGPQDFSPTAPERPSADIEQVANCSLTFNVAPPATDISCDKTSYQDELANGAGSYQLLTEQTVFEPGEVVVFSFELTNNSDVDAVITAQDDLSQLSDDASFSYTFLDSDCAGSAFDSSTETLTCTTPSLAPGASETFTFRIQLGNAVTDGVVLTNVLNITSTITTTSGEQTLEESCEVAVTVSETPVSPSPSPSPSPTPEISPTPSPTPAAYCNEACITNADCTNNNHVCYNGACRDVNYPTSPTCTPPLVTPTPVPSPTPVAYCNEYCVTNADCTNGDHICHNSQCRNANYPTSANCYPPQVATTPGQPQPQLPNELPVAGSEGFENWIKAGLGVLGIGALLLLLL
jgi:hypothetical protein